jgi:hypothetical protein
MEETKEKKRLGVMKVVATNLPVCTGLHYIP